MTAARSRSAGRHKRPRASPLAHQKPANDIALQPAGRLPSGYAPFLADLKARIRTAQVKAALSVNRELIALYWHIGGAIVERQRAQGWGKAVVDRLAQDLQHEFPGLSGFSPRNVWRMRAFYLAWTEEVIAPPARDADHTILPQLVAELDGRTLPQPVAEIPWGHNVWLLEKVKAPAVRLWYARKAVANGWSRAVLTHWIESDLHSRQGQAVTNFKQTLPAPQSDLAVEIIRDPYNFDFLTLRTDAAERDLERGLLDHIRRFLQELGAGFAFVGQQVPLEVDGEDFYLDLLFYHLRLRCYVVVDLKALPFQPEHAGKMNFYLSAVDDLLRHPDDQPSIGIILCKTRSKVIAEYALRDLAKPVGVARYKTRLVEALPDDLKGKLPTIAQIQKELAGPAEPTRRRSHGKRRLRGDRKGVGDGK
ncbi:MAG: PDDEXK nuclease domain-containing protein [Planctomycetota bacterium]